MFDIIPNALNGLQMEDWENDPSLFPEMGVVDVLDINLGGLLISDYVNT